ncbi:MAG: glycoside hydrolase family 32 protein, partial [Corynebacterium matruchotii]
MAGHPSHPHRKLVYWGHSSSTDLLHWRHHEPAIIPDSFYDRSGAYS